MKNKNVAFMTQAAMIAAIYVVLTYVFAPVFIRRSTDTYCRSTYDPSGIYTGSDSWTFRWMYCWKHSRRSNPAGYHFRKHCNFDRSIFSLISFVTKSRFLAPLPPIIANTVIVPFVLRYGYGVALPIPFMMLTVGVGEVVGCGVLGLVLYTALNRYKNVIFKTA